MITLMIMIRFMIVMETANDVNNDDDGKDGAADEDDKWWLA